MISFNIGGCDVDILPVVNGLVAETEKVRQAYGRYEAYGASLGIEAIEALKKREEIGVEEIEVSEIDIVYAEKMALFGDIQTPSPAFCELVDLCAADGKNVIPLDMKDYDFDTVYMDCIKATEFTSAHHTAKKAYKKKMDQSSPEVLAIELDRFVNKKKGFARLNRIREEHIAKEIMDTAKYRRSLLCVIEVERIEGVCSILEASYERL